ATFESYLYILPKLIELSEKSRLDEIYPKAVIQLGHKMVDQGVRWLDLTKDNPERVLYYVRWMDLESITRLEAAAELRASDATLTSVQVKNMVANVNALIPVVEVQFRDHDDLLRSFRRLSSDFAVKYLTLPQITEDEVRFWIGQIRLPSSM